MHHRNGLLIAFLDHIDHIGRFGAAPGAVWPPPHRCARSATPWRSARRPCRQEFAAAHCGGPPWRTPWSHTAAHGPRGRAKTTSAGSGTSCRRHSSPSARCRCRPTGTARRRGRATPCCPSSLGATARPAQVGMPVNERPVIHKKWIRSTYEAEQDSLWLNDPLPVPERWQTCTT